MKRFGYIDALRGYAILGVIIVHTAHAVTNLSPATRAITDQGARGVQLFFVASALTLMISWHERHDGVQAFFIRRFFRIAPMFWLAIPTFLLIQGWHGHYWDPNGITWSDVALTFGLMHGWHPATINSVVPGGWSIAVEMSFYLMFPVLAVTLTSIWRTVAAIIATYFVLRWLNHAAWSWYEHQPDNLRAEFVFHWLPNQLPAFLAGILVYHMIRTLPPPLWLCRVCAPLTAIGILILTVTPLRPSLVVFTYSTAFAVLAYFLSQGNSLLTARPIRWLGTISYSCYFWHFAVIAWITALGWQKTMEPLLLFMSILAIAATLSATTYRFVEVPGINFGRQVANKLKIWRKPIDTPAAYLPRQIPDR